MGSVPTVIKILKYHAKILTKLDINFDCSLTISMPLHQVAGCEETGDNAREAIADNESIELDSLFTITLHMFEHRY